MSLWEIDDDRLRALIAPLRLADRRLHDRGGDDTAPHDAGDEWEPQWLDELIARVIWSVVVEPGDSVAGHLIAAVGPAIAARLLFDDVSPRTLVDVTNGEVELDAAKRALQRWAPRRRWDDVVRCLEGAARCRAALIVPGDDDWPEGFDALLESTPVLLWARGDHSLLRRAGVAIVGARAATGYGEHVAMELAASLSARDVVIVSGGAYGIDGMAHRATLASGGATVAVLAGGVDRLYPSGHEALLTRVAEQGLLVSEAPSGSAPTKWRFLQRNRLIAALSSATVVVEAGRRSGALSTANHALTMGRPVGIVPGPVTSAASAGCHAFLRDLPSVVVTNATDVMLLAFGADGVLPVPHEHGPDEPHGADQPDGADEPALSWHDPMHTRVLDALRPRRGMTVEEVSRSAGEGIARVQGVLGTLELEGAVVLGVDGLWRRTQSGRESSLTASRRATSDG